MPRLITLRDAAELAGCSVSTLRRAARDGRLTSHRAGKADNAPLLVDADEVRRLFADALGPEPSPGFGAGAGRLSMDAELAWLRGRITRLEADNSRLISLVDRLVDRMEQPRQVRSGDSEPVLPAFVVAPPLDDD